MRILRTICCALVLLPFAAVAQGDTSCFPQCRDGYVCAAGQCVSKCNPICGAGERCTAAGECEAVAVPPPPPPVWTQEAPREESNGVSAVRELPGWALGGAVLGFISTGVVGGLAFASALTNSEVSGGPSLPLGASATLVFAITVPLVAGASSSVRSGTGASGSVGLRVTGWVLYGLTLTNAVAAVVLGITNYVPSPVIYSLAVLCMLTELLMSIEALVARGEASEIVEKNRRQSSAPAVRLAPLFSVAPLPQGAGASAMIGVGGTF